MIVALDTDVIVAALRSPHGASRRVLRELRAGRIQVVCTIGMFIECESVLSRPEHLAATGLTVEETGRFQRQQPMAGGYRAPCRASLPRKPSSSSIGNV